MIQGALRDAVVVEFQIVAQRRFKLGGGAESCLADDLADAAVEALHHAIRLRVARRNEAVFDHEVFAKYVERVLAGGDAVAGDGVFFLAREAVCELATIVGEQLDDVDRAGVFHLDQEVGAAAIGLVGIDLHEHPARRAVDRDEQIAPRCFVWHLWQVLDIYMDKARLVVLERLLGHRFVAWQDGHQIAQVGHAMAAQAAPQAGPGDLGVDELARDGEQVVRRQQERFPQRHDDQFLRWRQRGVHRNRIMGQIHRTLANLPLANRRPRDVVEARERGLGQG